MKLCSLALVLLASSTGFAMPNPASVYCLEQGGTLEMRTTYDGSEYGVCRWGTETEGSECEEWALFRGACNEGECWLWGADDNEDGTLNSFCRIGL